MYLIYRKIDRLVVGTVTDRRTESATSTALSVELQNIINSELGGSAVDYAHTRATEPLLQGKKWSVDSQLNAVMIDNPVVIERERQLSSAINKLTNLGLTADEVNAIIRIN